jgi:hypothetical protein
MRNMDISRSTARQTMMKIHRELKTMSRGMRRTRRCSRIVRSPDSRFSS